MHIAICDDNIADRKQLERLLERESDKRLSTSGNLYVDSYGSSSALMHNPMMYDLFLLDYHSENMNAIDLAKKLRQIGVTKPIVLMSGVTDYKSYANPPKDMMYINKPILKAELSNIISESLDIRASHKPPIAVQGEHDTSYFPEEDILYVLEHHHNIYVHLSDGGVEHIFGKISDLYHTLDGNPHFFLVGKKAVNFCHVTSVTVGKVQLDNGEHLSFPFFRTNWFRNCLNYAKRH